MNTTRNHTESALTRTHRSAKIWSVGLLALSGLAIGGVATNAQAMVEASAAMTTTIPQVRIAPQNMMVVAADDTAIRCGDQDVFYAIAMMKAGSVLVVLGESGSYTKVALPASVGMFVPVNEVDATVAQDTVVLVVDSKLRAPSHLMGLSGSWKAVYSQALPAGTELEVSETLMSDTGAVLGYRVVPMLGVDDEHAAGYVKTSSLRSPTAEELKVLGSAQMEDTTLPVEADVEPIEVVDQATDQDAADTQPVEEAVVDSTLMEEMDLGDDEVQAEAEPVIIENAAPIDAVADPEPTTRVANNGSISASALEDLEAAFDHARALDKADLDETLDELKAEYARAREVAEDGSTLANALDQRLEWIDIRIQTRDQRRSISALLAQYDANQDAVAVAIANWQSGRAYQLVGRMVTSSIYTGEHLPLLYRVQVTDPASGMSRTIGYVAPNESQDLRHLLGRVVGVVGSVEKDDSLKLMVISPDRVEPMPQ